MKRTSHFCLSLAIVPSLLFVNGCKKVIVVQVSSDLSSSGQRLKTIDYSSVPRVKIDSLEVEPFVTAALNVMITVTRPVTLPTGEKPICIDASDAVGLKTDGFTYLS